MKNDSNSRQEFEAFQRQRTSRSLERTPDGGYCGTRMQRDWELWQAAKASEAGSEPAAWTLQWPHDREKGRVNALTTYPTEKMAREYADDCGSSDDISVVPLYTHPAASVSAQTDDSDLTAAYAAGLERGRGQQAEAEPEPVDEVGCYDCGLKYGGDSWIEAVVPDKVWARIRPEGCSEIGGILCISCIAKRLRGLGSSEVPVYLCGTEPLKAMPMDPSDDLETLRSWDIGDTPPAPAPVVPEYRSAEEAPDDYAEDIDLAEAWADGYNQCRGIVINANKGG